MAHTAPEIYVGAANGYLGPGHWNAGAAPTSRGPATAGAKS